MSATLYLYRYAPEGFQVQKKLEKILDQAIVDEENLALNERFDLLRGAYSHFEVFDKNYKLFLLEITKQKSKTLVKFIREWEDRFVSHWKDNTKVLPVEGLIYHSSRTIKLKKRWFDREAWIHVITTKRGLRDFMSKYVQKESHTKFEEDIIRNFEEGTMFLEVSY